MGTEDGFIVFRVFSYAFASNAWYVHADLLFNGHLEERLL
jgi:hypothetical protein